MYVQADTLLCLNQASIPNIPHLLDHGALPTGESYMALTPVGVAVGPDTEPLRILQLARDAAETSKAMYHQLQVAAQLEQLMHVL
jgi:hypothetical protein